MINPGLEAAIWGGVSGLALILGALVGYFINLPHKVISSIMAFGAGVLISALSFELMAKATEQGRLLYAVSGFASGVLVYSIANYFVSHGGGLHRKRSQGIPKHAKITTDKSKIATSAGMAIALGALLDGIPESAAIGVSMLEGGSVALVTVFAVFMSNIPEGLSSSAGMKKAGKSATFVFTLWIAITLVLALSAYLGLTLLGQLGNEYIGFATALAAGAILVMIIQTMIPEAFEDMHDITGPIAAVGFLVAYSASEIFS